jgi:BioD-like phosphotransacetylase family protein
MLTCTHHTNTGHLPYVGYFAPIGGSASPADGKQPLDAFLRLVHDAFGLTYDARTMVGVPEDEAVQLVAAGRRAELLDRVYASFAAYRDLHDLVIVHGTSIGGGKLDAEIAAALAAPTILTCQAKDQSLAALARKVQMSKALLDDHKVRGGGVKQHRTRMPACECQPAAAVVIRCPIHSILV